MPAAVTWMVITAVTWIITTSHLDNYQKSPVCWCQSMVCWDQLAKIMFVGLLLGHVVSGYLAAYWSFEAKPPKTVMSAFCWWGMLGTVHGFCCQFELVVTKVNTWVGVCGLPV